MGTHALRHLEWLRRRLVSSCCCWYCTECHCVQIPGFVKPYASSSRLFKVWIWNVGIECWWFQMGIWTFYQTCFCPMNNSSKRNLTLFTANAEPNEWGRNMNNSTKTQHIESSMWNISKCRRDTQIGNSGISGAWFFDHIVLPSEFKLRFTSPSTRDRRLLILVRGSGHESNLPILRCSNEARHCNGVPS